MALGTDQHAETTATHDNTVEPGDATQDPTGAVIRKMSQRYIVGDISAEQAIELAQAHHRKVLEESGPPF